MSCIGTAGHIDHGKSTLVEALTGIDPDRLAEEKARGMTIDLGFAWLTLPGGREVSIVDVPGHEGFIKNMLAGVGGLDAALLVVAADEGVMPQTREHLAILDLLGVERGVVVLSKADLVEEEWLGMVREEVAELLKGTSLENAPLLAVSARTGSGLEELKVELERVLAEAEERQDLARPRLNIDRVFSMTGFGTVVTGTLLDGTLSVGQEVEIQPGGLRARLRGLQTHRRSVEMARPGSRVALNLVGVAREQTRRGEVVILPEQVRPTVLIDARVRLLASTERPLLHNAQIDFFCGTQEIPARVRLLEGERLEPGQSAWVQLRLSRAAVVARRDRFILRVPSPSATIGGGLIVDPQPRYHKRQQPEIIAGLLSLEQGAPDELILAVLDQRKELFASKSGAPSLSKRGDVTAGKMRGLTGYELEAIARNSHLAEDVTLATLGTLLQERRVRKVGGWWFAHMVWEALRSETIYCLNEQHRHNPLRSGLARETWRARLGLPLRMAGEVFQELLIEGIVAEVEAGNGFSGPSGGLICQPGFRPTLTAEQQRQSEQLIRLFRRQGAQPPGRAEAEAIVGAEVLNTLVEQSVLVRLGSAAEPIYFLRETYDALVEQLVSYLHTHPSLTAAEARDLLGTTRKFILPLLEHLAERRLTRREGDRHMLAQSL